MNDSVSEEPRLLAEARAGSHEAFARLHDRHAPVVLSLCRRATGSMAEAEDACQETFIRAHRRLDQLDDANRLRPWLYGIARRVCSERRRSAMRRNRHEGQAMLNAPPRPAPDEAGLRVERDEALARLTASIDGLDDRERLALHLYYLEADPVRAATSALGITRGGYYKLLARARRRLALAMQKVQPS